MVDLFCGAGGLTHGFIREGIQVVAGIDVDPECRYPFKYNNRARFIKRDIRKVSGQELVSLYPAMGIKILAGCAPCQPFSSYTNGQTKTKAARWGLLNEFARLVVQVRPEIVTMENVPNLAERRIFKNFIKKLTTVGYYVTTYEVDCTEYGIPQSRRRLVVFASLFHQLQ